MKFTDDELSYMGEDPIALRSAANYHQIEETKIRAMCDGIPSLVTLADIHRLRATELLKEAEFNTFLQEYID